MEDLGDEEQIKLWLSLFEFAKKELPFDKILPVFIVKGDKK